jgi:hypothetical protein
MIEVGPGERALFSIFGRQHKIAVRATRRTRRDASDHLDTARRLQQLPSACALRAGGFNSLSLIERAFPLWCLGNSVFELLPRREVENENAWVPVYCKGASRIPH